MPDHEFFTLKVLAGRILLLVWNGRFIWAWKSTEFQANWNGEFSLAVESPTIPEGGYTAVRLLNVGSLSSNCGWVAPAWPAAR